MLRIAFNSEQTEATIYYEARPFKLSADNRAELLNLVAMWQQPIETWTGEFATYTETNTSTDTTQVIELGKVA